MVRFLAVLLLLALPVSACSCGSKDKAQCASDADCKTSQKCVPTKLDGSFGPSMCVTGAECAKEDDCTAQDPRKTCDDGTHKCVFRMGFADDCAETKPCPFGEFCSTLLGRCFDASMSRDCVRRSQCPSGQTCDLKANKCIPDLGCYGDQFCEKDEKCDLVNHVCTSNAVECSSCLVDATCQNGGTCTADTKECLAGTQMRACMTGEKCDPLGRCVQCTASDQCGTGLFCNVSTGRCESNVQCADDQSMCPMSSEVRCVMCNAPEVCDPRTKTCQAPAAVCASDIDCPGDQFCNHMLDPPLCQRRIPDCLNDLREPDDVPAQASLLAEATGPAYADLQLCPGDDDWYKIEIHGATYLTIDARFRQIDGDIDIELFLADGTTLISASHKRTDNERVEVDVGGDATFLLHAYLSVPTVNPVNYQLVVTRDPGIACPADANEPDDTQAQAKPIASDMPFEGRICTANPDWFVLRSVPASTRIDATLTFHDSLGNLDLELYRSGATTPLVASATNDDLEHIVYDAPYGGDYYLRVLGRGADQNVYTLRVDLRANAEAVCMDDRFEPNDTLASATDATSILAGIIMPLTICRSDEDWYRVDLGPGEAFAAEIGFNFPADLELALYPSTVTDPHVVPLRAANGTSVREFLGYRSQSAGTFLLRVYGHTADDSSEYEMRLRRTPPLICQPDRIDLMNMGSSMADAFTLPMPPTRLDDLTICAVDEDWYQVTLIAGFRNIIRLHYIESDGTLDIAFFDSTGTQLGATAGTGVDFKEIAANVPGAGLATGFLRVFRSAGGDVGYSLTEDLIPLFTCLPDAAEPNDAPEMASTVASSSVAPMIEVRNLTLCANPPVPTSPGDEDWFLIRPPRAGIHINAMITFAQGDLFLELFSPGGVHRACPNLGMDRCYSDGDTLTEHVTFTATTSAPYYLRVGSVYSSPSIAQKPPNADTPYTLDLSYTAQ
jgi:hypothetical protein